MTILVVLLIGHMMGSGQSVSTTVFDNANSCAWAADNIRKVINADLKKNYPTDTPYVEAYCIQGQPTPPTEAKP